MQIKCDGINKVFSNDAFDQNIIFNMKAKINEGIISYYLSFPVFSVFLSLQF